MLFVPLHFVELPVNDVPVAAGSSAAWAQRVLDWNAASPTGRRLKQVCGLLVILAGLYLVWTAH